MSLLTGLVLRPSSSSSATDPLPLLVERMDHLEDLLISNLLGFFITATFTILAGLYVARSEWQTPGRLTSRQIFAGANVLYVFLSNHSGPPARRPVESGCW